MLGKQGYTHARACTRPRSRAPTRAYPCTLTHTCVILIAFPSQRNFPTLRSRLSSSQSHRGFLGTRASWSRIFLVSVTYLQEAFWSWACMPTRTEYTAGICSSRTGWPHTQRDSCILLRYAVRRTGPGWWWWGPATGSQHRGPYGRCGSPRWSCGPFVTRLQVDTVEGGTVTWVSRGNVKVKLRKFVTYRVYIGHANIHFQMNIFYKIPPESV